MAFSAYSALTNTLAPSQCAHETHNGFDMSILTRTQHAQPLFMSIRYVYSTYNKLYDLKHWLKNAPYRGLEGVSQFATP